MVANTGDENPQNVDRPPDVGATPHFAGDTSQEPRRAPFLTSEQLLFGIVALKNNFISREQLVAGFDAWIQNKCRNLAELLEQQRAIDADDRAVLERLVTKLVARHGGDIEQSLAAVGRVSSANPGLDHLPDPELQRSLGHVAASVEIDADPFSTIVLGNASRGRFRILRAHAKGGLGQVFVALDQELHREVALKEILPQHADDLVGRERFVLEAEITGGLEHPGIVPVYALGQDSDGRPYYAMRFIKGDSLKQAIDEYHHQANAVGHDPGLRQIALRQLLGRFIDICNAIEYAHSRGVLHRDLKPANVMIGKYGETLVVDWGLAKAAGKKELESGEVTLRPKTSLSSSGQTMPGQALGTPAYMSPEQATGRLAELGPATDIYSLGATLYHILTGRPPFEGPILEVLKRVEKGQFPRPSEVTRGIAPDLEAICLKAMALQPMDRYKSARVLADDLERWLADEPTSALPDRMLGKLKREYRKNPARIGLIAVAALLGTRYGLINAVRLFLPLDTGESLRVAADLSFRIIVIGAGIGGTIAALSILLNSIRNRNTDRRKTNLVSHERQIILGAFAGAVILLLVIKSQWTAITGWAEGLVSQVTGWTG